MGSSSGGKTHPTDVSTVILETVGEMAPLRVTHVGADAELVAELGFDSLGLVELLAALEDILELPPVDLEALSQMTRVADLQRMIREAQARMPPAGRRK
jgi:acyl carrier protein